MKICFITTLIGKNTENIDKIGNFENFNNENYDFLIFTNLKDIKHNSWKVIYLEDEFLDEKINNKEKNDSRDYFIYKSRFIKFMGWKYIKENLKKDYDVIFYCDGILSPNKNIDWESFGNKIKNSESGLLQKKHPSNSTPYSECDAIFRCKKETLDKCRNMIIYLHKKKVPKDYIITENTSFGFDPSNNKITEAFTEFWKTYIRKKITYRDQPLWGYISYKFKLNPIYESNLHKTLSNDSNLMFQYTGTSFNKYRTYY